MNKYPGITIRYGKRGKTYVVRYRDAHGKSRGRSFKTLTAARNFKSEVDHTRRHGGVPHQSAHKVTFAALTQLWLVGKHHRESTARRRDGILNKHLLPELGHLTLDKIHHSTIQDLVNKWTASGLSPYSVRNHLQILSSILNRAVRDDIIMRNPAVGTDRPRASRQEPRSLSPEECLKLLGAAGDDYSPIIEMLLVTGCRWSEFASLNVGDFSAQTHTLQIRNSKTDAGNRVISLEPRHAAIITKHLLATGRSGATDGPLFTSPNGVRLNYANFRTRVFIPAVKRAELGDVTVHTLRRTHATMLIADGKNAKAVQHRMGHTSIETTLAYYATATEDDVRSTASSMTRYLERVRPFEQGEKDAG